MKAADVMTQPVISVDSNASILEAVRMMLQDKISGLPVVNHLGHLVGIVTEGDFVRRIEIGTQRRRPRLVELFVGPGLLADEYVHTSSRKVAEVMTREVHTAAEDASLQSIVRLMERHGIKRVPVLRAGELVGIITRANLMRALVSAVEAAQPLVIDDATIHDRLMAELEKQPWAPLDAIDIAVHAGVVTFSGLLMDERQRRALTVAAENIPGVRKVVDHIVWIGPRLVASRR